VRQVLESKNLSVIDGTAYDCLTDADYDGATALYKRALSLSGRSDHTLGWLGVTLLNTPAHDNWDKGLDFILEAGLKGDARTLWFLSGFVDASCLPLDCLKLASCHDTVKKAVITARGKKSAQSPWLLQ
jgi:hypothetical protein